MKLAWATDIHLNFVERENRLIFYNTIIYENVDGILLTGDMAEAPSIITLLREMLHHVKTPIYFVLGNHDYYRSSIQLVRQQITQLTQAEILLQWLPAIGVKRLTTDVALVGEDGWADGRLGNYHHSPIVLNDSCLIAELFQEKLLGKSALLNKMQILADADADNLKKSLQEAIKQKYKKIIVLTHIPPFKPSCLHEGKISNDYWLPYFSAKATGDVLTSIAQENPLVELLVLCGHTHNESFYQPFANLTIKAGKADYGHPIVQDFILLS